jgi:hypothetical protein
MLAPLLVPVRRDHVALRRPVFREYKNTIPRGNMPPIYAMILEIIFISWQPRATSRRRRRCELKLNNSAGWKRLQRLIQYTDVLFNPRPLRHGQI